MTYKIGDIINEEEFSEASNWCNDNNATITEIEPDKDARRFQIIKIPQSTEDEQKEIVRNIRNVYLETHVDPYQLVLRWESLPNDEKESRKEYRNYLLNYTEEKTWWEHNPLTFEEWLKNN